MKGEWLFQGLFWAYTGSALLYILFLLVRDEKWIKGGKWLLGVGVALNLAYLIWRGFTGGRFPMSNMFEFVVCFMLGIAGVTLLGEKLLSTRIAGAFTAPFNFALALFAYSLDHRIAPLVPALQSVWLAIHVSMAIIAYGAYALSCAFGIMYMIKEKSGDKGLGSFIPPVERLDVWMHKTILTAFPFLSLLIIFGALWAEEAWGRYWAWDPKEVWSLITWLIYATYLHLRYTKTGQNKKLMASFCIAGFVAVIFTYLGVSYLLTGLHAYKD